ncbi:unnamed protein product [Strongylus vulgaris]|uniref:MD-2-related lipid-recognition domain-containing protein n=1 Tax=Strongylus vulgaris TaxID=40348 RepID=A0A3P7JIK0_STRVU|nr:unnamed protein product [Strongylus vulgaris]
MQKLVLLLALSATALACKTWPNGTDTTFHWYQCNAGPMMFYNATPYDQTGTAFGCSAFHVDTFLYEYEPNHYSLNLGKNFEYPIHLSKPIMVKCDVLNPTHVYSAPALKLTISLWSWGTAVGGCDWSSLPTFGLLNDLNACQHGIPCPIQLGRQEIDVMVDFTQYQAIINILKDDAPYQLEYAMHDKTSGDNICLMAQARARIN